MTRLVLLGSRPLAKQVLEFLLGQSDVEVIGMVVRPDTPTRYWRDDPADLPVPHLELAQLATLDFDLGVSVNYWRVLEAELLSRARLGFVNVHHSYNLRLRGRHCTTYALWLARATGIWHHGSTLHFMTPELDAGPIIASVACSITELDTAQTLFTRTEAVAWQMCQEWLPRVWREHVIPYAPPAEYRLCQTIEPTQLVVDLSQPALQVYDQVRALVFPPYDLPFALPAGRKRHLTIGETPHDICCDAGAERRVYWAEA